MVALSFCEISQNISREVDKEDKQGKSKYLLTPHREVDKKEKWKLGKRLHNEQCPLSLYWNKQTKKNEIRNTELDDQLGKWLDKTSRWSALSLYWENSDCTKCDTDSKVNTVQNVSDM